MESTSRRPRRAADLAGNEKGWPALCLENEISVCVCACALSRKTSGCVQDLPSGIDPMPYTGGSASMGFASIAGTGVARMREPSGLQTCLIETMADKHFAYPLGDWASYDPERRTRWELIKKAA